MKTETPLTDSYAYSPIRPVEDEWVPDFEFVSADFARSLERDRDALQARVTALEAALGNLLKDHVLSHLMQKDLIDMIDRALAPEHRTLGIRVLEARKVLAESSPAQPEGEVRK